LNVGAIDINDVVARVGASEANQALWASDAFTTETVNKHRRVWQRFTCASWNNFQIHRVNWVATQPRHAIRILQDTEQFSFVFIADRVVVVLFAASQSKSFSPTDFLVDFDLLVSYQLV